MARAWETLDTVATSGGPLELRRRGERDFLIVQGTRVLMTSAAHRSEDDLGTRACAGLDGRAPRVLIGGLGMGYTLRAVLDAAGAGARVVVAEIEPAVVRWCRSWLAPLTDVAVADPRVLVRVADVAAVIREAAARGAGFDAIALDLYEGPRGDRAESGHPVYGDRALRNAARALAPGGVLAVWSEAEAPGFERRLEAAGFAARRFRAGRGGRRHTVYTGVVRPDAGPPA